MSRSGWHRKGDTAANARRAAEYASPEHRAARAAMKARVDAGDGWCWRCGRHLPPGSRFHAGHDDNDRSVYRGAECPPCNLKAAARKGNRISNARRARRQQTSADRW